MNGIAQTRAWLPPGPRFRAPAARDGAALWRIVRDSGALDPNSPYCYLLLCKDFAPTCVVAERGGGIAGFVSAYRPPERPETIFVWQIGVDRAHRGAGVALGLLETLLRRKACRGARFLETTIAPSNGASRALFASFARRLDADCVRLPGFAPELFPDAAHEPEELYRIGPFPSSPNEKRP